ncbi:MAG: tRNA pseudouridine(38-40) synthase TruA [Bacteroidetes bacterium]|nr:tRNA pseudouridine(38-40) synthase TruA [Bacteroidota bacterium]
MSKYKFYIEYDGTGYSGWQKQKNAKSVQETIINVILSIFKDSKGKSRFIDFQGSGRTDAGVHAYEQIAHLECETMLAPEILKMKINDGLPSSINILEIEKADSRFHARHSAKSRQYVYRISKRRNAFEKKYCWWIKDKLNVNKMKDAAKVFIGMNDFISFSEKNKEDKSTKCLVEDLSISEDENFIYIRIKASHFLWKMVRRVTGVLAEAGRGRFNAEDIKKFLKHYSDEPAKFTAPPSGLFLEKIYY